MTLPNFVVIGAGKSGTTSLYFYLKQHPDIYVPTVKETNFFAVEGINLAFSGPRDDTEAKNYFQINTLEKYQALFADAAGEHAIGEVSPYYIYSPRAAQGIYRHVPNAKIICILRNPVDRAYSNYLHLFRDGREPLNSFEDAIASEDQRIKDNWSPSWHYAHAGFYYDLLQRYFEYFSEKQIKVFLYEDYISDPQNILSQLFDFLEVDSSFQPDMSTRYNASGIPKNPLLHSLLSKRNPIRNLVKNLVPKAISDKVVKVRNANLDKPPTLSPQVRKQLQKRYRPDIIQLQNLIQTDLSRWLN